MELEELSFDLTVCKVADIKDVDLSSEFFFLEKTDEEISLVCRTEDVPEQTVEREDGWRAFRIKGVLDFSLIGILSKITEILAENKIGIFAVSTYNTDYILVKSGEFDRAMVVLAAGGYSVV
ncbi:MAG: ACT domain-containing protein [Lachnospiraceae bacterium]|nr:ACT domain-containing protein [Lachnospiraceae bacterium]